MRIWVKPVAYAVVAVAATGGLGVKSARANAITINYFEIAETDKDANKLAGGSFSNEVQSQLGVNGLPVLNTAAYGCTNDCFSATGAPTDVLPDGEITYWSPSLNNGGPNGTSDVTYTGSAPVTLPFVVTSNFFAPNGTGSSDSTAFMAATMTGTLDAPTTEKISFSIGADDMAFVYLDGSEVCDLGGVHGYSNGTCVTPFNISAGSHSLELFFVDINTVQSALGFNVTTQGVAVTGSPVPEPASVPILGSALLGMAACLRRQARRL